MDFVMKLHLLDIWNQVHSHHIFSWMHQFEVTHSDDCYYSDLINNPRLLYVIHHFISTISLTTNLKTVVFSIASLIKKTLVCTWFPSLISGRDWKRMDLQSSKMWHWITFWAQQQYNFGTHFLMEKNWWTLSWLCILHPCKWSVMGCNHWWFHAQMRYL